MPDLSIPLAGMTQAANSVNAVASRLARLGGSLPSEQPQDSVSLSSNMIELMSSQNDYETNVKVAKTFDEMNRSTLDILA